MRTLGQVGRRDNREELVIERVVASLREVGRQAESFEDVEATILAVTNEACRRYLEERLQSDSTELDDEVLVDGVRYRAHQPGRISFHSLCGPLRVRRWTYREVGVRNGPTVVPLELDAGIVERCTPAMAFGIARGYADLPMRDYEEQLRAAHRMPPSRSTLERAAKRIGTAMHEQQARIEPRVRRREQVPPSAVAINIGLDRTTTPMEEDGEEGVEVRYRMAYVATLAFTASDKEVLVTRRYAVPAHEGPEGLLKRLMADVSHAKKQRPELLLGVVQDGAPELWNLIREALRATPGVDTWRETFDRYHVIEKLARVLAILVADPDVRAKKLDAWNEALDKRDNAIVRIEKWLDHKALTEPNEGKRDEARRTLGCYFVNRQTFRYASLHGTGLLQGSGITEAACKTLVTQRTKRSGQRWRPRGISAVLALKTLCECDRLAACWRHFKKGYTATVLAAA